jgi:hypothetical protein
MPSSLDEHTGTIIIAHLGLPDNGLPPTTTTDTTTTTTTATATPTTTATTTTIPLPQLQVQPWLPLQLHYAT